MHCRVRYEVGAHYPSSRDDPKLFCGRIISYNVSIASYFLQGTGSKRSCEKHFRHSSVGSCVYCPTLASMFLKVPFQPTLGCKFSISTNHLYRFRGRDVIRSWQISLSYSFGSFSSNALLFTFYAFSILPGLPAGYYLAHLLEALPHGKILV